MPAPVPTAGPFASGAFSNYQYDLTLSPATFSWAQGYCNARGGSLVSITSQAEQDYLQSLVSGSNVIAQKGGAAVNLWMGLKLQVGNSKFWLDGNAPTFTPPYGTWPYTDGSCYSLRCDPGINAGTCYWFSNPLDVGCTSLQLDGFICKTEANKVLTTWTSDFAQSSYFLMRQEGGIDWASADLRCQNASARLISINSYDENLDMVNALQQYSMFLSGDLDVAANSRSWMGLKFNTDYYNSIWTDGKLIMYNPNTVIQPNSAFQCWDFVINKAPAQPGAVATEANWAWAFNNCLMTLPTFICEIKGIYNL